MKIIIIALLFSMTNAYPSTCEEMRDYSAYICPDNFNKLMDAYGVQCGWDNKNCLDNSQFNQRGYNEAVIRYTPDESVNYAQTVFLIDDWNGNILDEVVDTQVASDDVYTYIAVDCTSDEAKNFCDIVSLYSCQEGLSNRILAIDQYFYVNGDDVEAKESLIAIIPGKIGNRLLSPIVFDDEDWSDLNNACAGNVFSDQGVFNTECFFNFLTPLTTGTYNRWVEWNQGLQSTYLGKKQSGQVSDVARKKMREITKNKAKDILKKLPNLLQAKHSLSATPSTGPCGSRRRLLGDHLSGC